MHQRIAGIPIIENISIVKLLVCFSAHSEKNAEPNAIKIIAAKANTTSFSVIFSFSFQSIQVYSWNR